MLAIAMGVAGPGCGRRESLEDARARATEPLLIKQITELKELVARAERGELTTQNRIAIGISEATTKEMFDASLPQEKLLADRVHVRLESAQAFFRGNNAAVVFQATARGKVTGVTARLELGGRLRDFRIEQGRLRTSVDLAHFKVLDSSLGDLGGNVLDRLIQDNLDTLAGLTPPLEIPVHLEESITLGGLDEGVVATKGGVLPLAMTLAEVIPVNERLWILLDVKVGPWQNAPAPAGGKGQ
jgi:hypothetical protein